MSNYNIEYFFNNFFYVTDKTGSMLYAGTLSQSYNWISMQVCKDILNNN